MVLIPEKGKASWKAFGNALLLLYLLFSIMTGLLFVGGIVLAWRGYFEKFEFAESGASDLVHIILLYLPLYLVPIGLLVLSVVLIVLHQIQKRINIPLLFIQISLLMLLAVGLLT